MERIYQMRVVPDVLPEIRPSLDLRVVAKARASEFFNAGKVQKEVEPGVYLLPKQVCCLFLLERCALSLTSW